MLCLCLDRTVHCIPANGGKQRARKPQWWWCNLFSVHCHRVNACTQRNPPPPPPLFSPDLPQSLGNSDLAKMHGHSDRLIIYTGASARAHRQVPSVDWSGPFWQKGVHAVVYYSCAREGNQHICNLQLETKTHSHAGIRCCVIPLFCSHQTSYMQKIVRHAAEIGWWRTENENGSINNHLVKRT